MDQEKRKKIIDTIAKMQRIANPDSKAFQGEMDNASRMAKELMEKYIITEEELHAAAVEEQIREVEEAYKEYAAEQTIHGLKQWHWDLARLISRITHTRYYSSSYRGTGKMKFFGQETNAEIAAAMYAEWLPTIEHMAYRALVEYARELERKYDYKAWERGKNAWVAGGNDRRDYPKFQETIPHHERATNFKSSWLTGCLRGMREVIDEQERARDRQATSALAVYDQRLADQYQRWAKAIGMRSANIRGNGRGFSEAGYSRGTETGSSINIGAKRMSSTKLLKG